MVDGEEETNVNDVDVAVDGAFDVIVAGAGRVNELSREQYSTFSVLKRRNYSNSSTFNTVSTFYALLLSVMTTLHNSYFRRGVGI